jgi:hypothetical protein
VIEAEGGLRRRPITIAFVVDPRSFLRDCVANTLHLCFRTVEQFNKPGGGQMVDTSGIEAAIQELTREQQRLEQAIKLLRHIRPQGISTGNSTRVRSGRRLSAETRKRISGAPMKRWVAMKSKGKAKT